MKIITYGTFDLLHWGHINLLQRAKRLGDHLTVGLSTDEFNKEKNKESVFSYNERLKLLQGITYVDNVIPEFSWRQKVTDIQNYNIDIFVIGDDWVGEFDELKEYCQVIYLPRTKGISSTFIKRILS